MADWSKKYALASTQLSQSPVYILAIAHDTGTLKADITAASTSFGVDANEGFDALAHSPVLLWDDDGYEFMEVTDIISEDHFVMRGQYGTTARAFEKGRTVFSPRVIFSSATVDSTDLPIIGGVMRFPSGGNQACDLRNGRLTTDNLSVDVVEKDGVSESRVTYSLKSANLIGKQAVLFGGYAGMDFKDYSFLYLGRVAALELRDGCVYNFQIEDVTSRLSKKLFGHLEDFESTDTSDITAGSKLFTAYNDSVLPVDADHEVGDGRYAAYYLVAEEGTANEEWMRLELPTPQVVRGSFGTTDITHTNTPLELYFAVEDNPIDVLLGLLISRHAGVPTPTNSDPDGKWYAWSYISDSGFDPVGLGIPPSEIDFTSFEYVRQWYANYKERYIFDRAENMKSYIEKYILKPHGLCFFITNTGKLGLMIARPPLDFTATEFGYDSIVGVPTVRWDNTEIINDVTVQYNWNAVSRVYDATPIEVIDSDSIAAHDMEGIVELEARGLATANNGQSLAKRLARNKKRHFSGPNPVITVPVLLTHGGVNPGDVVRVNHSRLPDPRAGTVGWNKYMLVVGKRPNWDTGALEFDVIDTQYLGKRYGLIAPDGTSDYGSASDAEKATYAFISGATEKMSDDTDAYQIM
ncbi:MAG: hypothetical protein GY906_18075 [bacterium]|nr:hypothetical protein [bacterium]